MAEKMRKGFRGSVHGFKRKDVNEYIIELSKKYTEAENEYLERIAALEKENERLSSMLKVTVERAADAEARASEAAEGKVTAADAKKAAEALTEIKKMRSQLKKRVKEFESKYGDILPIPEKGEKNDPGVKEEESAASEMNSAEDGSFESYLNEFRSSTSALFNEFDKKYGTRISEGVRK